MLAAAKTSGTGPLGNRYPRTQAVAASSQAALQLLTILSALVRRESNQTSTAPPPVSGVRHANRCVSQPDEGFGRLIHSSCPPIRRLRIYRTASRRLTSGEPTSRDPFVQGCFRWDRMREQTCRQVKSSCRGWESSLFVMGYLLFVFEYFVAACQQSRSSNDLMLPITIVYDQ